MYKLFKNCMAAAWYLDNSNVPPTKKKGVETCSEPVLDKAEEK